MKIKSKQIKRLVDETISKLSRFGFIESINLVGSHSDLNIDQGEKIIDLDFVIIVDRLTNKNYHTVSKEFTEISKKFSSNKYNVVVERKIGPIKTRTLLKNHTIILHQIVYDIGGYRKYSRKSVLASYDWQRCLPLYGKPLNHFIKIKRITKNELIKKRLGIDFYINAILKKEIDCVLYQKEKELVIPKIKSVRLSKSQQIELMYHALFNTLNNLLKTVDKKNVIYAFDELNKIFFKKFKNTQRYQDLFLRLHHLKTNIRSNKEINPKLNELRQQTICFLKHIKTQRK